MRIRLDQRLELLLTAMFISDYDTKGFCVDPEDEYAREALEKFGSFVAHPAVANISRVWGTEIDCSSPPHYALTLTEDIKLDPTFNLDHVRENLIPNADLSRFTADLRGFHRKADFTPHFSQLQSRLAPWLEIAEQKDSLERILISAI